jgi:hypothetical protein
MATFDITLVGRNVTVVQNGQTIIDNKEIPGITAARLIFRQNNERFCFSDGAVKPPKLATTAFLSFKYWSTQVPFSNIYPTVPPPSAQGNRC